MSYETQREIKKEVKPKYGDIWKFPSINDSFMIIEVGFAQIRLRRLSDGYEYSVTLAGFSNNYYFHMTYYDYKNSNT